jgi:hypothetical protein
VTSAACRDIGRGGGRCVRAEYLPVSVFRQIKIAELEIAIADFPPGARRVGIRGVHLHNLRQEADRRRKIRQRIIGVGRGNLHPGSRAGKPRLHPEVRGTVRIADQGGEIARGIRITVAGHRRAPRHELRRIDQRGILPCRILEDIFVVGFRAGIIARAEKIIGHPPLGLRGEVVGRKLADKPGELREGIGVVARLVIRPGGGINRLGAQIIRRKIDQPAIVIGDRRRPVALLLVTPRNGQFRLRQ